MPATDRQECAVQAKFSRNIIAALRIGQPEAGFVEGTNYSLALAGGDRMSAFTSEIWHLPDVGVLANAALRGPDTRCHRRTLQTLCPTGKSANWLCSPGCKN